VLRSKRPLETVKQTINRMVHIILQSQNILDKGWELIFRMNESVDHGEEDITKLMKFVLKVSNGDNMLEIVESLINEEKFELLDDDL
jgi:hypothetical protein